MVTGSAVVSVWGRHTLTVKSEDAETMALLESARHMSLIQWVWANIWLRNLEVCFGSGAEVPLGAAESRAEVEEKGD